MSMSNLGSALSGQGKYAEVEKMHRATLGLREKVSGKEHPHTLTSMDNLAQALNKQVKYAEAETCSAEPSDSASVEVLHSLILHSSILRNLSQ